METIEDMERFKVHNAFTPIETPRFLQKAANEELSLEEVYETEDGTMQSYEVKLPTGNMSIRNKKFIKHAFEKLPKMKKVHFADELDNRVANSITALYRC